MAILRAYLWVAMAAITTAQSGDWNTGATWTGGVKPGNGDTATINHAVTVSTSEIVGTSPVSGGAVALACNAALTIQSGGFLKVRGPITLNNVAISGDGGGIWEFDSSLAASPSTTFYDCLVGTGNGQTGARFVGNGSAANNTFIVRSNSGGGNGYFRGGADFSRAGLIRATFTTFLRIGDATNDFCKADLSSGADQFSLEDCILDACGRVNFVGGWVADAIFKFNRTTMKNSVGGSALRTPNSASISGGTREIINSNFDIVVEFWTARGITIDHNYFAEAPDFLTAEWASFTRNIVRSSLALSMTAQASSLDNYALQNHSTANPHFMAPDGDGPDMTFDGWIFEYTGTDAQGDCILAPNATNPRFYLVRNCIVLPNGSGNQQSGTLWTSLGNANVTWGIDHCTYHGSGTAPNMSVGETFDGVKGQCKYLRNSIAWGSAAGDALFLKNQTTPAANMVTDIVRPIDADYNCLHNGAPGMAGNGYDTPMSSRPGIHDVHADPQFLDSTRNVASWDASLGGPGTVAHALAQIMARNDHTSPSTGFTPSALIAFVRVGQAPRNRLLKGAASDGGDMGAVPCIAPSNSRMAMNQRAA